jgi:hypothetical protein
MAKRVFQTEGLTFATQTAATALTTSQFMAAKGGTATQVIDFLEFLISGTASNSNVANMTVAYSSTLGITPTALASPGFDGPMMVNATTLGANAAVTYFAAATGPVMNAAATLPRLNLGLNLFGGIIRWNAAPTQQWTSVGNAVNAGETVLFNSIVGGASTGPANAHIIYEPY